MGRDASRLDFDPFQPVPWTTMKKAKKLKVDRVSELPTVEPSGRRYVMLRAPRTKADPEGAWTALLTRGEALELAACIIGALSKGESLPRR